LVVVIDVSGISTTLKKIFCSGTIEYPVVVPPSKYDLTIGVSGSGTTDPDSGVHTYDKGADVDVLATPAAGWELDHWELDGVDVGDANPYTVTMDDYHVLTAVFTEIPPTPEYDLTISVSGSGATSPPVGVYTYVEGSHVAVTATPDAGWEFSHWMLDGVNVGDAIPYMVTMNEDHALSAVFTEIGLQTSTVGPGIYASIRTPFQRQCFYSKGLHWVFFLENMAIRYRVSSDGVNWGEPVLVTRVGWADFFSLHYDGIYIHYVCTLWGPRIWYRRGTPQSNGAIIWSAGEQDIPVLSDFYSTDPTICVDTEGFPWVGCYGEDEREPLICKSGQNNGTWISNDPGYPFSLNPVGRQHYGVIAVPLTSGKIYAIYLRSFQKEARPDLPTAPIYGRLWDGTSWGPEEQVSVSNVANTDFHLASAVAVGDDVHITFLKDQTYDLIHLKRTWPNGWEDENTIVPSATPTSAPVISYSKKLNRLYCFWAENNAIFYSKFSQNDWVEPIQLVTEEEPITCQSIMCSYEDYDSIIGVLWYLPNSSIIRYTYITPQ